LQISKWQLHETRAVDRRANANARLISNQGAVDLHLDHSSVANEAPRNQCAGPGPEADAGMVGELLRGLGHSTPLDIGRRPGHPEGHVVADPHSDHVARDTLARPDTRIKPLFDDIDEGAADRNV